MLLVSSFTACDGYSKSEDTSLLMTKIDDPMLGMTSILGESNAEAARKMQGHAVKSIEYKHCIENGGVYYEDLKSEVDEGNEFNDVKSIEIVDKCPPDATAKCAQGDIVDRGYYYTNSQRVLDNLKDQCLGGWTLDKNVVEEQKATAKITVNGTAHNFETNNNCIQIAGEGPVSTPLFSNESIQFGMNQMSRSSWDFNYMLPNGDGRTATLYKGMKGGYQVDFNGKKIIGKAELASTKKQSDTVDVSFDINCL